LRALEAFAVLESPGIIGTKKPVRVGADIREGDLTSSYSPLRTGFQGLYYICEGSHKAIEGNTSISPMITRFMMK
jgi:hypothetical protein